MSNKKNKIEYERKFLLFCNIPFEKIGLKADKVENIIQKYFEEDKRFRISFDLKTLTETCELIVKTPLDIGSNIEIELELTQQEIKEYKSKKAVSQIIKIRTTKYITSPEGIEFKYEIDYYPSLGGLTVLEVETETPEQEIYFADWIKKYILCEVTDKEEFKNINLSLRERI